MANRNMNLDVIVRMKDLMSGPFRRLNSMLKSFSSFARKIGVVGAAVAGISFMGPMQEAAAFQQQLIDIAGTANLSGQAAFKFVDQAKSQYEDLALSVGQASETIAAGAGKMIADGIDRSLVDASIGKIGKAATAANAEFSDMASVATSLLSTLKLPAEQLDDALGGLVIAGKEGAFELKDMARYFPTLTSQMAKFGVTGREAVNFLGAALQIARKGTSDPAEAANNLKNFLSKILAPMTIKSFKEAGVDIQAVMQDAATKGINPIEAVMQKIVKLTGVSSSEIDKFMSKAKANGLEGAEALSFVREQLEQIHGAGALGNLFADQQVMDFLIPFLTNVDEYKRIKDEVAKATGANIDADFERQMEGLNRQLVIFKEIGTQASREVGLAFGAWLPTINEYLMAGVKRLRELDASTGGMLKRGLALGAVAILAATGLGALAFILPVISAGFGLLFALISPIGLILAGIAVAGIAIYKNWKSIGPFLGSMWDKAKTGLVRFASEMKDKVSRIVAAGKEIGQRFGPRIAAGLADAWRSIKSGFSQVQELFTGFKKGLGGKADLSGFTIDSAKVAAIAALETAMTGIGIAWEKVKGFGSGFATHLSSIGENLGGTINAITDIASGIGRIVDANGPIITFTDSFSGLMEKLGASAGEELNHLVDAIRQIAEAVATLVNTLADISEGKADWSALIPDGVVQKWNDMNQALLSFLAAAKALPSDLYAVGLSAGEQMADAIKTKIDELVEWFKSLPSRILAAVGSIEIPFKAALPSWLGGDSGGDAPAAANNNGLLPATQPQNSKVTVGGEITVTAANGATVKSANSNNSSVPIKSNTAKAVGRD